MTKEEVIRRLDEIGTGPELARGKMKWRIPCFNKLINAKKALQRNNIEACIVWIMWANEHARGGDPMFPQLWKDHVLPKLELMGKLNQAVVMEGIKG